MEKQGTASAFAIGVGHAIGNAFEAAVVVTPVPYVFAVTQTVPASSLDHSLTLSRTKVE